jgi:hypothetical protein
MRQLPARSSQILSGRPLALGSVVNRVILPARNRCEACGKSESELAYLQKGGDAWPGAQRGSLGVQPKALRVDEALIEDLSGEIGPGFEIWGRLPIPIHHRRGQPDTGVESCDEWF